MRTSTQDALGNITRTLLEESPFGDIEIKTIVVTEGSGPDDEAYLHLIVVAADPDPKVGTWSRESMFDLRKRVRTLVAESPETLPQILVDVHPFTSDEEPSEEETGEHDAALSERLDDADD